MHHADLYDWLQLKVLLDRYSNERGRHERAYIEHGEFQVIDAVAGLPPVVQVLLATGFTWG